MAITNYLDTTPKSIHHSNKTTPTMPSRRGAGRSKKYGRPAHPVGVNVPSDPAEAIRQGYDVGTEKTIDRKVQYLAITKNLVPRWTPKEDSNMLKPSTAKSRQKRFLETKSEPADKSEDRSEGTPEPAAVQASKRKRGGRPPAMRVPKKSFRSVPRPASSAAKRSSSKFKAVAIDRDHIYRFAKGKVWIGDAERVEYDDAEFDYLPQKSDADIIQHKSGCEFIIIQADGRGSYPIILMDNDKHTSAPVDEFKTSSGSIAIIPLECKRAGALYVPSKDKKYGKIIKLHKKARVKVHRDYVSIGDEIVVSTCSDLLTGACKVKGLDQDDDDARPSRKSVAFSSAATQRSVTPNKYLMPAASSVPKSTRYADFDVEGPLSNDVAMELINHFVKGRTDRFERLHRKARKGMSSEEKSRAKNQMNELTSIDAVKDEIKAQIKKRLRRYDARDRKSYISALEEMLDYSLLEETDLDDVVYKYKNRY